MLQEIGGEFGSDEWSLIADVLSKEGFDEYAERINAILRRMP